jgi:thioredoxin 1|tara:strand:- start:13345 stop:13581 length:237 start_codon:yes stop_codon:yes gene_type:complete
MKEYLYFSAPWCGPCKMLSPVMEQVGNTIPVNKINVDEQPDFAQKYGIRSVPTVVLLEGGVEVKRHIGVKPVNEYLSA